MFESTATKAPDAAHSSVNTKLLRVLGFVLVLALIAAIVWMAYPYCSFKKTTAVMAELQGYQRVVAAEPILRRTYVNLARAEQKSLPSLTNPAQPVDAEAEDVEFQRGVIRSGDVPGLPNDIYPPWDRAIESGRARDIVTGLPQTKIIMALDGNSRAHRKAAWFYLDALRQYEVGVDCLLVLQGNQLAVYSRKAGKMVIELQTIAKPGTLQLLEAARRLSIDADGLILITSKSNPGFSPAQAQSAATALDLPKTVVDFVGRGAAHTSFVTLARATDGSTERVVH